MSGCNVVRTVAAGAAYGVFDYLVGFGIWEGAFKEETASVAHLWRPQDDSVMLIGMPLASILTGIMIAIAYCVVHKSLSCPIDKENTKPFKKGAILGLLLWLIIGLGKGTFWYTLSPIPFTLLLADWIHSGLSLVIGTGMIAIILGNQPCKTSCSMGESKQ